MSNFFKVYLLHLLLLISISIPCFAVAQALISNISSGSVDDRITQLERISNAYSQLLTQIQQQLSDNQRDIDLLRGQLHESQHRLSQVVEQQKQCYHKVDNQISSINTQSTATNNNLRLIENGVNQDIIATSVNGMRDDIISYNEAVALMLEKKQYDQAISAFQSFVKSYPNSAYNPNANYWLGQLHYKKDQKDDAAYYFAIVVKNHPKSMKAPDALLKIGVILQEKGQKENAKVIYQKIGKLYPTADAAKQAQKRLENL